MKRGSTNYREEKKDLTTEIFAISYCEDKLRFPSTTGMHFYSNIYILSDTYHHAQSTQNSDE